MACSYSNCWQSVGGRLGIVGAGVSVVGNGVDGGNNAPESVLVELGIGAVVVLGCCGCDSRMVTLTEGRMLGSCDGWS